MNMRTLMLIVLVSLSWPARAGVQGSDYVAAGTCGVFPRADLKTPTGTCVGIVAGPAQGLQMPRTLLEISDGTFLVVDMVGWGKKSGRVLKMSILPNGEVTSAPLVSNLNQPHGIALGPDKKVYVGEVGRIFRFDPMVATITKETVHEGLPTDGRHPLLNFVFDRDGALIVNIGAPSDRCENSPKNLADIPKPCPQTIGDRPRAALWKLTFDKPGGKVTKVEALARGLRNSMALAVDPETGAIIQGENSLDLPNENAPPEELNVIKPGAHYGWPFCFGMAEPLPKSGTTADDCKSYQSATMLLPAHSAPLGMMFYRGNLFPELKGKLIVGLHGYRKYGHQIVAVDPRALSQTPATKPAISSVVGNMSRKPGTRPQGSPVGLTEARDGSIWFAEDKGRTIMVLRAQQGPAPTPPSPTPPVDTPVPPMPIGWEKFSTTVLRPKCATCHFEVRAPTPLDTWTKIAKVGWVDQGRLETSKLVRAMRAVGPEKPMPPPTGIKADPQAKLALDELIAAQPLTSPPP